MNERWSPENVDGIKGTPHQPVPNQAKVNDGKRRLKEWTQHQLNVGFDHVYVFDNSGAFTNDDDLKDVTSLFGSKYVTRIPWVSC